MSHKRGLTLNEQACERFKQITCLGRSKHDDKILAAREYDHMQLDQRVGTKQEYINASLRDHIYSYRTYETYEKHNKYFTAWIHDVVPDGKDRKTLEQVRQYVPTWLTKRINEGLSPYTIATEAAGLAKLYGCSVNDFGVKLPERTRAGITRSREHAARDYGFNLEKHADIISFCRGTGLRRDELENLTGTQLIRDASGSFGLDIIGKGGKERFAPIVGPHAQDIIDRCIAAGDAHVWSSVPSHMDVHSYRSDYATAIYTAYARDDIPREERYYCRGDRKGMVMDKTAMLQASKALGHNRLEVVAGHYIR
jgi:hypothetical protein